MVAVGTQCSLAGKQHTLKRLVNCCLCVPPFDQLEIEGGKVSGIVGWGWRMEGIKYDMNERGYNW